ncbi:MAG TPA: DUF192 domain-containing protein [Polyangia bacterium]|nr:DUF192 domain-containing protein [Polyangia bacterium]
MRLVWGRRFGLAPLVLSGWLAFGGAFACRSGNAVKPEATRSDLRTSASVVVPVAGRNVSFRVELARTPEEHERGLMYRPHLDPDAGMLFLFDRPAPLSFWMKNTLIPLDMLFIDADHKIVGIVENAEPQTLTSRRVDEPAQYVLEIGGGLSARLGIHPGAIVEFRDVLAP